MERAEALKKLSRLDAKIWKSPVIVRACGRCEICRTDLMPILEVHHVIPVSEGGPGDKNNLIAICPNCHALLHKIGSNPRRRKVHLENWIESSFGPQVCARLLMVAYGRKKPR